MARDPGPKPQGTSVDDFDENAALEAIVAGTASETGEQFFQALVKNLAEALGTAGAWVTEYFPGSRTLRPHAFWLRGGYIEGYEKPIDGTPCEVVVDGRRLVHLPNNVLDLYPEDEDFLSVGAVSYLGVPLLDSEGGVLGHLAVLHTEPLPPKPRALAIFRIFAARAAAELRRLRAEKERRDREEQLRRLVDGAMDAIIELDADFRVTLVNRAAEQVFQISTDRLLGVPAARLFSEASFTKLVKRSAELASPESGRTSTWITDGLEGRRHDGAVFSAEATLSRYRARGQAFQTLVLRDVNERLEAERRIHSLSAEAEYLRAELREPKLGGVLGRSPAMRRVLDDVLRVAETDSTVLLLGETGTGKSLVARELQARSLRSKRPFVRVNCAAIPAALLESEFFGHVKGAFTGATQKRDGRFLLADGGTLFLDEIGDLPADLQVKLLHVLQEGEFEPVGSSVTKKVDVRVIAATSRNLKESMARGSFREDLYYRLNVFPIELPPLRARGDDVIELAEAFVSHFGKRVGRPLERLSEACRARLLRYTWPGNVRELENVIERAVILGRDGRIDVERALPEDQAGTLTRDVEPGSTASERILTSDELRELERSNIERALALSGHQVSGETGAAKRLGMNASTLSSRIKALGIKTR
jgi:PAS domain S-box-containing protein